MRWKSVIAITLLALSITEASGEVRTWIDKNGQRITAEYLGFKDGVVVLMQGVRKYRVPLSTLSDADQEFVRQKVTEEAEKAKTTPDDSSQPAGAKPKTSADAELLALLDSIPKPTPKLFEQAGTRVWTDRSGNQRSARFAGVREDGSVTLRFETYSSSTVAIEALARKDLEYIRDYVENDGPEVIFPPGQFQSLTSFAAQTKDALRVRWRAILRLPIHRQAMEAATIPVTGAISTQVTDAISIQETEAVAIPATAATITRITAAVLTPITVAPVADLFISSTARAAARPGLTARRFHHTVAHPPAVLVPLVRTGQTDQGQPAGHREKAYPLSKQVKSWVQCSWLSWRSGVVFLVNRFLY